MKRLLAIAGAALILTALAAPVALAAEPLPHDGRVLISVEGDVTLPKGEHADAVVVVRGDATILGEANTVVAIDGAINLDGATVESIVAVRSPVNVGAGSTVLGDVRTLDATVHQFGDAEVLGQVRDVALDLAGIGLVLAPVFFLWYIGAAVALIVAGLVLAALAARQVRAAEELIRRRPLATLGVGIAGLFVPLLVALVAIATIVGGPLGVGILLGAWPLAAFIGYLVAAIWIGDWVLRQVGRPPAERPYLAAVVGVLVLQVAAIVPPIPAIASLFGFGAVLLLAWQTFRGHGTGQPADYRPTTAPVAA